MIKKKEEKLDEILENLFQRGVWCGILGYQTNDGEYYAVRDAKQAIKQLIIENLPKEKPF